MGYSHTECVGQGGHTPKSLRYIQHTQTHVCEGQGGHPGIVRECPGHYGTWTVRHTYSPGVSEYVTQDTQTHAVRGKSDIQNQLRTIHGSTGFSSI